MAHVVTLNDLSGQTFCDVPQVAAVLNRDERTVRRALEAGKIPGRKVGNRWAVPVSWLRQEAGVSEPAPDTGVLADQVANRVVARLARLLAQASAGAIEDS
jgi:Helix-turn-helix domain